MRRASRSLAMVVAALMLVSAACTDDAQPEASAPPSPSDDEETVTPPSTDVAVVLSPRNVLAPEAAARIGADLQDLADLFGDDLDGIRVYQPDDPLFTRDIALVAAREGVDLLCLFGPSGRRSTTELVTLHPGTRFCALSPVGPPDETVDGIDIITVPAVELGYLLGAAAHALAGPSGSVTLALGPAEVERRAVREGFREVIGPEREIEIDKELDPGPAITAAVEAGAEVVVIGSGPFAPEQVEAALEAGAKVIAEEAVVAEGAPIALSWHLRWDVLLRPAVERLISPGVEHDLVFGLNDDVLELTIGPAAPDGFSDLLDTVAAAIEAGEYQPPQPGEGRPSAEEPADGSEEPSEPDAEDPADGPDDDGSEEEPDGDGSQDESGDDGAADEPDPSSG